MISYTIARRTNEIGIRMALGASEGRVLWMVLRETLLLALAGIVLGLLAVLASARVLSSRLFGLSAYYPLTIAAATAVLVASPSSPGSFQAPGPPAWILPRRCVRPADGPHLSRLSSSAEKLIAAVGFQS